MLSDLPGNITRSEHKKAPNKDVLARGYNRIRLPHGSWLSLTARNQQVCEAAWDNVSVIGY